MKWGNVRAILDLTLSFGEGRGEVFLGKIKQAASNL